MRDPSFTDYSSRGMVITWRTWHVGVAVFCVFSYVAVTDQYPKKETSYRNEPFAQIERHDVGESVWSLVFSSNKLLGTSTTSGLLLSDLKTGQAVRLRSCPWSWGLCAAFSPDGRILAVGGTEPMIRLWDTETWIELEPLKVGAEAARCVAFSLDGTTLALATWASPVITFWEWPHLRRVRSLDGGRGNITVLSFSTDGRRLLAGNSAAEVRIWDVASSEQRVCRRVHDSGMSAAAFSPDGSLFATASFVDVAVRLWDAASGQPRGSLPADSTGVTELAFSPDGTLLATSQRNGVASLWNLASARQVGAVRVPTGSLQSIAFTGDGQAFATGDSDGFVRLWDVAKVVNRNSQQP